MQKPTPPHSPAPPCHHTCTCINIITSSAIHNVSVWRTFVPCCFGFCPRVWRVGEKTRSTVMCLFDATFILGQGHVQFACCLGGVNFCTKLFQNLVTGHYSFSADTNTAMQYLSSWCDLDLVTRTYWTMCSVSYHLQGSILILCHISGEAIQGVWRVNLWPVS